MWASGPVWMGMEYLVPTRIWSPNHPAHSKLLYQLLSWPTFCVLVIQVKIRAVPVHVMQPYRGVWRYRCTNCYLWYIVEVRSSELFHLQKGICVWERQTVAKSWSLDSAAQELLLLHLPALLGPLGRYCSLQESESPGWNVLQVSSYRLYIKEGLG